MRRFAVIALLMFATAAGAEALPTPQSFVAQMKANGPRVAVWAKVFEKDGQFRQVVFRVTIQDVDVVASQSLLRPYLGKAKIRYSSQHGPLFASAKDAAAATRAEVSPEDPFGECEVTFVPRGEPWQFEEARCRNSITKQWMLMDRAVLLGTPLGDMLAELDTPLANKAPLPTRR